MRSTGKVIGSAIVGAAVLSVTTVAVVRSRARSQQTREPEPWPTVTVLAAPERFRDESQLPAPLLGIQSWAEVQALRAPGGRGTELSVRPRYGIRTPADDRAQARKALRRAKQLIEVGEVLMVEPKADGRRRATPVGLLTDAAARRADEMGVL